MFALSLANPFRRHASWEPVRVLFGAVRLQNDYRVHLLIGRRVRRRYSTSRRQWIWSSLPTHHVRPSVHPQH